MQYALRLVLASSSPRRRVLLRRAGFTFRSAEPAIDETARAGEAPDAMVDRLAGEKALSIAAGRGRIVLGADTTVSLDGAILAKPAGPEEAVAMLIDLGGRSHDVYTGFALVAGRRILERGVEHSTVTFSRIDDAAARAYVATGEPLDKAGAYAIQGLGRKFVTGIDGSFTNVMGLPMERVVPALLARGVHPEAGGGVA